MTIVEVGWPVVKADTVEFSWKFDGGNDIFAKNSFYIKYDGINLDTFPRSVFWNAFLALLLPVFKLIKDEVILVFPESIPVYLIETWSNYHSVENVFVFPISEHEENRIPEQKYSEDLEPSIGILYGGGKDSTFAFSVLSEIYGMNRIVLYSYVFPDNENAIPAVDQRREKCILAPIRKDLNVRIQKVITNVRTIFKNRETAYHIQLAIYTGTIVPALIKHNTAMLTHSNEFDTYWTGLYGTGEVIFNYRRARPEYDSYISQRTNSFFGTKLSIKNINVTMPDIAALKVLVYRYPHMLKYTTTCENTTNPEKKWCYKCSKCGEVGLYNLYFGIDQNGLDMDYFLTESQFIKDVLKETEIKDGDNLYSGNWPYTLAFGTTSYFEIACHALASTDPETVKKRVSEKGYQNFMILKRRYGNVKHPIFECFIEPALKLIDIPEELENRLREIVTPYCAQIKEMPPFVTRANENYVYDYNLKCEVVQKFDIENYRNIDEKMKRITFT